MTKKLKWKLKKIFVNWGMMINWLGLAFATILFVYLFIISSENNFFVGTIHEIPIAFTFGLMIFILIFSLISKLIYNTTSKKELKKISQEWYQND